jgi:hypothetical protein
MVCFGFRALDELFGAPIAVLSLGLVATSSNALEYAYYVPWNNAVTYACLAIVGHIVLSREYLGAGSSVAIGLCVGWTFAARYVDALFVGLPALPLVWWTLRERRRAVRERLLGIVPGALVALFLVLGVFWSHESILGSLARTPYATHIVPDGSERSDQDPSVHHPRNALVHLRETWVRLPEGTPVEESRRWPTFLEQLPLLWLSPIGFVIALRGARSPLRRRILWAGLAAFLLSNVFYGAYYLRADTLKFSSQRYLTAWLPVLMGFSLLAGLRVLVLLRDRCIRTERGSRPGAGHAVCSGERAVRPEDRGTIDR